MTSIHRELLLELDADLAWTALRDFGNAGRVFAGALIDARREGDVRTVSFANRLVARERLIDIDDERRRIAYTVMGELFEHHSASMQIVPEGGDRCRFIWISDFLPDDIAGAVSPDRRGMSGDQAEPGRAAAIRGRPFRQRVLTTASTN